MFVLYIGDLVTDVAVNGQGTTIVLSQFLRDNAAVRYKEELGTNPRFATPEAKPVTSSNTINVPVARSAYRQAPAKPLAGVGNTMVVVLFTIVTAIWLTLLAQIWRVRRVCRGIRQPTTSTA